MKNIRFKFIGALILVVLVLGSCKKWIDTGINVNPDAPTDAPMKSLLPAIQANMAYNTVGGNDAARVTSIWLQYFQGIARQSQGSANYIWKDGDVDNQWNTNYAFSMMDLTHLIEKAKSNKHNMYLGIADILMANSLGLTTDLWGDVPYTDAFQGLNKLQPSFDKQEDIYKIIINLLDEAITSLSSENLLYAYGDVMYGNSDEDPAPQAALWLKAAHGMKARYLIHRCKVYGSSVFTDALAEVTSAMADNSDDLQFNFGAGQGNQNPLFQFMDQRGDVAMHQTFIDTLKGRFDPRIPVYATAGADTANPYQGVGWDEISTDNSSLPGEAVAAETAPVIFLSYAECLFIKAECELQADNLTAATADLVAGLSASLNKWGVYSDIYVQFYSARVQGLPKLALYREIMMQKYFALYNQVEAYCDWRRTDNLIGLSANPNTLPAPAKNEIPRRFPYSLGEKSYNPSGGSLYNMTIYDRVWWDAITNPGK
jgi:hypothetical protein